MSVCQCLCTFVCLCMWASLCICLCICVHLCVCVSLSLCVSLCVCVCARAGMRRSGRSVARMPCTTSPSSGTSSACWWWWACCRWASSCLLTSPETCWVSRALLRGDTLPEERPGCKWTWTDLPCWLGWITAWIRVQPYVQSKTFHSQDFQISPRSLNLITQTLLLISCLTNRKNAEK